MDLGSGVLGFDALAVDGPNPVGIPQPRKKGRPPKEGKEKEKSTGSAQRTALPGDAPFVPPSAPARSTTFSVADHIEMTKKKEATVKKALGIDLQEPKKGEKEDPDADEKRQLLRQIAQYRRSFGSELSSTKKLSLATPLDELKDEYDEIQREVSTKGSLEAARLFLIAGMHSLEHMNKAYDPFGLRLDGLGQATVASMDQVQPILEELVIKYSRWVTLGPEARLGMALAQTLLTVHAANTNPDLMKEVAEAAGASAQEARPVDSKFKEL